MLKMNKQRGDTLIEAMFALTVFGFIVVTALSLMNQGVSASQRSLEITTVRQEMDGQAQTLRFLHEAYIQAYQPGQNYNLNDAITSPAEEYYKVIQFVKTANLPSASQFGGTGACVIPNNAGKNFIMNPVTAQLVSTSTNPTVFKKALTSAQLSFGGGNTLSSSNGIWVEGVRSAVNGTNAGYIDYHIRACWDGPGLDTPMNLGTIVRLYEPRA